MTLFDIDSGGPWGFSKECQNYTIWRAEFVLDTDVFTTF